jgi:hypothetical protein
LKKYNNNKKTLDLIGKKQKNDEIVKNSFCKNHLKIAIKRTKTKFDR